MHLLAQKNAAVLVTLVLGNEAQPRPELISPYEHSRSTLKDQPSLSEPGHQLTFSYFTGS